MILCHCGPGDYFNRPYAKEHDNDSATLVFSHCNPHNLLWQERLTRTRTRSKKNQSLSSKQPTQTRSSNNPGSGFGMHSQ